MNSIFSKLKERKEYESRLIECTKPFMSISGEAESYLSEFEEATKDFELPVRCYFYWFLYFKSMLFEVIFPLTRTFITILKRRFYPILFDNTDDMEEVVPCTYSEAFLFFKEIGIDDCKIILKKWATPVQYVNILEYLERGDKQKFVSAFAEMDNVAGKLSSINLAARLLPICKLSNSVIEAISTHNLSEAERVFESICIEDFENGYDWSRFDSVCDLLDDFFGDTLPGISGMTQSLRSNLYVKRIYEELFYPCHCANDYSNARDVEMVTKISQKWGVSREFQYFWKDAADLSYAFLCFLANNLKTLSLTDKELEAINTIINCNGRIIPSSRLHAIQRWITGQMNESHKPDSSHHNLLCCVNKDLHEILLVGMPYFEVAKKKGLIKEDGEHLKWTGANVLLAYFCGRIYCGDYVRNVTEYRDVAVWISGGKHFPEKDIEKLFNVSNLAQQRRTRTSERRTPPKGYQDIDAIIEGVNIK